MRSTDFRCLVFCSGVAACAPTDSTPPPAPSGHIARDMTRPDPLRRVDTAVDPSSTGQPPEPMGDDAGIEEPEPEGAPGEIHVQVADITGQRWNMFVGTVSQQGQPIATFCERIDADPFDTITPGRLPTSDALCDEGEPMLFEPGDYVVEAKVLESGTAFPHACDYRFVTLSDGDVNVTVSPHAAGCIAVE